MKKIVKIVTPAELTYQKTVHTLVVEIDGVVYTAYRVEDCNGADLSLPIPTMFLSKYSRLSALCFGMRTMSAVTS